MDDFVSLVKRRQKAFQTFLCLGLDPLPEYFSSEVVSEETLTHWGLALISLLSEWICAVKIQIACYEAFGRTGWQALENTISAIPRDLPVILDAKRGDIESTTACYARAYFSEKSFLGRPVDAVTVSPWMGKDSVLPFLSYPGKMAFVVCHTTSPGSTTFQSLSSHRTSWYETVAQSVVSWGSLYQIGLVVGGTHPESVSSLRRAFPKTWFLVPGIGSQGAGLEDLFSELPRRKIFPISRSILSSKEPLKITQTLVTRMREMVSRIPPPGALSESEKSETWIPVLARLGILEKGTFELSSGRTSSFYLDLRRVSAHPSLFRRMISDFLRLLSPLSFDRIAAVPTAALPWAAILSWKLEVPLVYPRKDGPKAYGMKNAIEGVWNPGDSAVLIEDVTTTGNSFLSALSTLRDAGLKVTDAVVGIERREGHARERLKTEGVSLHSVWVLEEKGGIPDSSWMETISLKTRISEKEFFSCVWNASGVGCTILEELDALEQNPWVGAVVTKSCTLFPREGHPEPRFWSTQAYSLNSMGLPNPGLAFYVRWLRERKSSKPVFLSLWGESAEEIYWMLRQLPPTPSLWVELNLSCPNVSSHTSDLRSRVELVSTVLSETGIPWGIKLPPYGKEIEWKEISTLLNRYVASGLRFVTCVNSLSYGLDIDIETESMVLRPHQGKGGIGGRSLLPLALANVRTFRALLAPAISILGCGGVTRGEDVFKHLLAGASAVEVGTQFLQEGPDCFERLVRELKTILKEKGYTSLEDFQGKLRLWGEDITSERISRGKTEDKLF